MTTKITGAKLQSKHFKLLLRSLKLEVNEAKKRASLSSILKQTLRIANRNALLADAVYLQDRSKDKL